MDSIEDYLKRYPRITLPAHKATVKCVRWNPEGNVLASGGKDKMLHMHKVVESNLVYEPLYTNNGHVGDIDQLCWNPANTNLLATASIDKQVKIWDCRNSEPIKTIRSKNENVTISWSNTGSTIAVGDKGDAITFLDTRKGFETERDLKFTFEVGEITWNKECDLFFVTSGDGNIHVLNYQDLQTLLCIDAHASPISCIRFDPTGKRFATGSNDAISSIWDSENLACIHALDRLEWPVKAVSFSYDGRFLASGSEDFIIDIANVYTGQQEASIDVNAPVLTIDFHPKEYIMAYAVNDQEYRDMGTIKVVGFPDERRRY